MAKTKEVKLLSEHDKAVLARKAERQATIAEAALQAMRTALAGADEGRFKAAAGHARRAADAAGAAVALTANAASGKHGGNDWESDD